VAVFADGLLPLGGENEVQLVMEIPSDEGFPLAGIKPDTAVDRVVDAEIEAVSNLVAGHDGAGFRTEFHDVLELAGRIGVGFLMAVVIGGGKGPLPLPVVFRGDPMASGFRAAVCMESFFEDDGDEFLVTSYGALHKPIKASQRNFETLNFGMHGTEVPFPG